MEEGIIEVGHLGRHHVKVQTMVEKGKRVVQMIIAEIPIGILSKKKSQQAEKKRAGKPGEKTGDAVW
jgi:dUTPase